MGLRWLKQATKDFVVREHDGADKRSVVKEEFEGGNWQEMVMQSVSLVKSLIQQSFQLGPFHF